MNKIAIYREKIGITQDELAQESGLSKSLISQMETNQKNITRKSAAKLAPLLGCSVAELLLSDDELPPNHLDFNAIVTPLTATVDNRAVMPEDLSVYGTVECGDGDYMELSDEYKIKRPFVWRDRANEVYALRASGESMTPRFFPGETVYVDTKLKPRHGSEVVIQIHDGNGGIQKAMLKVYIKKTPTVYVFMSYNPDYEQNIEIPVDQVKSVDVIIPAAELVG